MNTSDSSLLVLSYLLLNFLLLVCHEVVQQVARNHKYQVWGIQIMMFLVLYYSRETIIRIVAIVFYLLLLAITLPVTRNILLLRFILGYGVIVHHTSPFHRWVLFAGGFVVIVLQTYCCISYYSWEVEFIHQLMNSVLTIVFLFNDLRTNTQTNAHSLVWKTFLDIHDWPSRLVCYVFSFHE